MATSLQGTHTQHLIGYDLASRLIAAAIEYAKKIGVNLSFVVLDTAGHLVASARMDGAAFITIEVARGKAFASVATGGQPGGDLAKRFAENPMVWGNIAGIGFGAPVLPAAGALPIKLDGQLIGTIGASGAPSHIDEKVILAAIQAIGASPG